MSAFRVCLIDDDIFVRDALSLGLRDAGYDVVAAPGAAAGLDIAKHGGVGAIVTDMNMPGTGGAQLIAEARALWPKMVIVAISGATVIDGRPVPEIARELGADETLVKPFRARQLAEVIERARAARDGSV
ncbi:response regulator [Terricaulis sp.]|uniref:response regulator n=1 Tax=Terricaulis sp. TaxID=2768686 RepID=UPI003784C288